LRTSVTFFRAAGTFFGAVGALGQQAAAVIRLRRCRDGQEQSEGESRGTEEGGWPQGQVRMYAHVAPGLEKESGLKQASVRWAYRQSLGVA
jgi:hypothetical protein